MLHDMSEGDDADWLRSWQSAFSLQCCKLLLGVGALAPIGYEKLHAHKRVFMQRSRGEP